jgi:hypothetical protein
MLRQEIIYYFKKVLLSSSATFGTFCIELSFSVTCRYLLFVGGVLVCNFVPCYIYIYIYTYIHTHIHICMYERK